MSGWPGSAYQYHSTGYLNQLGFTNISNNLKDYTNPQKGLQAQWRDRFSDSSSHAIRQSAGRWKW